MIPKLFQLGPISVYSYGLMMGVAFIVANVLLTKELTRRRMDANMGATITLLALVGGLAGAKLFYLFENMDEFDRGFFHAVFSPAGLTFYGGLIVAILLILGYLRIKKVSFLRIADTVAPALILAYGIGRIGCQLAGDGDYGIPTQLPWGMTYAQGTAKPSIELQEYFQKHPEEDSIYHYSEYKVIPVGRDEFGYVTKFDETVHVHPTPLYETLYSVIIFFFLWAKRKEWDNDVGKLFAVYLILSGAMRFLVEFLRLNPLYFSLSMSQWIGIASVIAGIVLLVRKKSIEIVHLQLLTKDDCSLCEKMKTILDPECETLNFDYEEIKIHPGDRWWDEYWEKIPVLLANGKLIAKYSITKEELTVRVDALRKQIDIQPAAITSDGAK